MQSTNFAQPTGEPRRRAAATLLGLALAACATRPPGPLPGALAPEPGEAYLASVAARGVQIYECRAAGAAGAEWAFVAPEAVLLDAARQVVGSHGAGPFWQAQDGSRVTGTLKSRFDAPVAGAIPWLLLSTRASGPAGSFSRVSSIQRVNTSGGVAPASGCRSDALGAVARVPYTADYHLYAAR